MNKKKSRRKDNYILFNEIKEKKSFKLSLPIIKNTKKYNIKNKTIAFVEFKNLDIKNALFANALKSINIFYYLLLVLMVSLPFILPQKNIVKISPNSINSSLNLPSYISDMSSSLSKKKGGMTLTLADNSYSDSLPVSTWVPYWSWSDGIENTAKNSTAGGDISAFMLNVTSAGELEWKSQLDTEAALARAHNANLNLYLTVTEDLTGDEFADLLVDPIKRGILVSNLSERAAGYDGLDLDFEKMLYSGNKNTNIIIYEKYPQLISELAERLHRNKKSLIVTLMAGTPTAQFSAINYKAIGESADKIRLMCYDLHTLNAPPAPLSSVDWINDVVGHVSSMVESRKIILGLPTYSHAWFSDGRRASLTGKQTRDIINSNNGSDLVDEPSQMNIFTYNDKNGKNIVYYPGKTFITEAVKLALDKDLGGIVLWSIGDEDENIWQYINDSKKTA